MANFPGAAPATIAPSAAPAALTAAPLSVSQALGSADAPAEAKPVLSQGVVNADEAATAEGTIDAPSLDANLYKTAAALETHLAGAGVDPFLAKFYSGRVQQALSRPEPSAEQLAAGHADAEAALVNEYGDTAEHIGRLARDELHRLTRDFPDLPRLLERTGLGNDLQVIKALASRAYGRLMDQKRAEFGLPPQER